MTNLNIDNEESVQLKLGSYYEKGQTRIQKKENNENEENEENEDWHNIYTDKKITPNKEINLWYHNIVGPPNADEYKNNIGKIINIKYG